MQKIVNAHCHIYPEKIASKAVIGIKDFYDLDMSLNGKLDDLYVTEMRLESPITWYIPLQQHQSRSNQ